MDKQQKKLMREAFNNRKVSMGVFSIRNLETDKTFIKSTMNAEAWENKAKFILKMGQFENAELQADWKQLGENRFQFEMIEELEENENPYFDYQKELQKMEARIRESYSKNEKNMY